MYFQPAAIRMYRQTGTTRLATDRTIGSICVDHRATEYSVHSNRLRTIHRLHPSHDIMNPLVAHPIMTHPSQLGVIRYMTAPC